MEAPVVLAHVAERGGNTALRGDRVRARREHFGQAGCLQAFLCEPERGAQTRAARTDDDHVVFVLLNLVGIHFLYFPVQASAIFTIASTQATAPSTQKNLIASCEAISSQRVCT